MPEFDVSQPPRSDASADMYAALRAGLENAGYSQPAVCEYFGLAEFADFFEGHAPTGFPLAIESPLAALCQLFLLGRSMDAALLQANLGEPFVDAALETALVGRLDPNSDALIASASLYPLKDLWIASDRVVPAPGTGPRTDIVYPAATHSAGMFMTLLPRRSCARFLEVCGGCGPAAVLAGEFADETTASDLEPRSAAFAAFNGRLQNLDNFHSISGSFYTGTPGLYDCIAAHPPYMPAMGSKETYYGGGSDGTEVMRGLLAELPERLSPGGLFYAVVMVPQGRDTTVEQNLRIWLGESASQFDVFTFPHRSTSAYDLALSAVLKSRGGMPELVQHERALVSLGHQEFVLGAILLRRHLGHELPIDCRRKLSPSSGWRELLWCVDWEVQAKGAAELPKLLAGTLRLHAGFELHATHKPSPEGLPPVSFRAITSYPFAMESHVQGWMSHLFARADGSLSGEQLMSSLIEDELLHPETPALEFAQLLRTFVSGGFLETSICPFPSAAG